LSECTNDVVVTFVYNYMYMPGDTCNLKDDLE